MTEPTPAAPPAMPDDPRQDPAIAAGYAAQAPYEQLLDGIRNDPRLSDLAKAEQVAAAYEAQNADLDRLQADLHGRRTARLDHLKAQIPHGPGVPADASPADRAVMMAAFRSAVEQARTRNLDGWRQMLTDAIRFGDETTLRAVITTAVDAGDGTLVREWATATGNGPLVAEITALQNEINGMGPSRPWAAQAFRRPSRPREVGELPALRKRAEDDARRQAADRTRQQSSYYPNVRR